MYAQAIKTDRKYTFEDYLAWDDGQRWEIIDVAAYAMSPAPSNKHQEILSNLHGKLWSYLQGRKCRVYPAPFDVILPNKNETAKKSSSTVQPDLSIVCDPNKTKGHGCKGAPDLIIEILSSATIQHDKITKFKLYERHGVREYWIVDPSNQAIDRFYYDDELKKFGQVEYFARGNVIKSVIFPDLEIKLEEVFPEIVDEWEIDEE